MSDAELWIMFSRLAPGGFGRVMWERDFMDLMKYLREHNLPGGQPNEST